MRLKGARCSLAITRQTAAEIEKLKLDFARLYVWKANVVEFITIISENNEMYDTDLAALSILSDKTRH